jgi:hypothetical protein
LNSAWWTILGIAPTDDVRSVKRAYAVRLKGCRPEDDPQGFAQLREAYEAILSRLTSATKKATRPVAMSQELPVQQPSLKNPLAAVEPVVPPRVVDVVPVAPVRPPPTMSPHLVAGEILEEARRRDGQWPELAIWLHNHEDLISLDFKIATSEAVLRRIATEGAPSGEVIDAMAQFFGWDDYRRTGKGTNANALVAQVKQRFSESEFVKWLDAGPNQRNEAARTLKTVRKLGDGMRARLMASWLFNRNRVLRAFRAAAAQYGDAALPVVLGEKTVKFWHRALAPQANLLQLALTIPLAVLTAALISLVLPLNIANAPMPVSLSYWMLTLMAGAFFCLDLFGIGLRLWNGRCLPYVQRKRQALLQVLHLQQIPAPAWRLPLLVSVGIVGWRWPQSFPDWPFYVFVLCMSLGFFKDRRALYGCGLATLGACVLFGLFFHNGKVPFLVLPLTLWSGQMLHALLSRLLPRVRTQSETLVLILGMTLGLICLALAGLHIS